MTLHDKRELNEHNHTIESILTNVSRLRPETGLLTVKNSMLSDDMRSYLAELKDGRRITIPYDYISDYENNPGYLTDNQYRSLADRIPANSNAQLQQLKKQRTPTWIIVIILLVLLTFASILIFR